MTLEAPTHTLVVFRPEVLEDQDPFDPEAEALGDPIASGVPGTVWFPRDRGRESADPEVVVAARFLADPIPGVELQEADVLEDNTGQRWRVEWAVPRTGVPGLEHTAGELTAVKRRTAV